MEHPLSDQTVDVFPSLLSLTVNNNVLLNVIIDLLIEMKAKSTGESIGDIEKVVNDLIKTHHDSAFKLLKKIK